MNILVTGGAGFIGTNLIKSLLEKNHIVYSLDDYSTGLHSNEISGCKYIYGDLSDIDTIQNDIDIVYHLAARARIQPSFEHPEEYIRTNFEGTYAVVRYCIRKNIPLIYAGSSSKHNGKFKNPYTFSKDIGEEIIHLFRHHYGLKSTIVRFYNVYGPYHLKEGGYTTLIGAWEKRIEENKSLIIYGDGTKRRDFTHVDDIIDGLKLILEKQAWNYIFELGKGKNYSIKEIADMFGKEIEYKENKPGEAFITLCIDTLAKEILGWEPKHNIEDYIKNYLNKF